MKTILTALALSLFCTELSSQVVSKIPQAPSAILDYQKFKVNVYDEITYQPVVGAKVTCFHRVVEINNQNHLILKDLNHLYDTGIEGIANTNGSLDLTIPIIPLQNILWIQVSANGYSTSSNSLVFVDDKELTVLLSPSSPNAVTVYALSQNEESRLNSKNVAKALDVGFKIEKDEVAMPKAGGGCTYGVSSQIYVSDLYNGYNSYSCNNPGTGFTGYMSTDEFVAGAVAGEMGTGTTFSLEAKKAQAVTARTYGIWRNNSSAGANCGMAYSSSNCPTCVNAANGTSGEVILYNGNIIQALFSARCNGNLTQNSTQGTFNPASNCNLTGNSLPYCICKPCSGHSNCSTTGELPCCYAANTCGTGGYIYGHGVGLCQRGSQGFANQGYNHCDIINSFFTGVCITQSTCGSTGISNDDCSQAISLNSSTTCNYVSSSVAGATSSGVSIPTCTNFTSSAANDVWFSFTAQATSHTITVDPEGSTTGNNSYIDPVIALYSSCSANTPIQCEDDAGGGGGNCNMTVNGLTVNNTYYIRVFDYGTTAPQYGGFDICVTHTGGSSSHDFYVSNLDLNAADYQPGDALEISVDQYTANPNGPSVSPDLEYTIRTTGGTLLEQLGTDNSVIGNGDDYDGESLSTSFPSGISGTSCQICAEANFNLAIAESNTSNNRSCITINLAGGGNSTHDFYTSNLTLNANSYEAGDALDIDVDQYTDNPNGPSVSPILEYTIRTTGGTLIEQLGTDNSAIGNGDDYDGESLSTSFPSGIVGNSCQICAEANYDMAISETNTSNNRSCVTVSIIGGASFFTISTSSSPSNAGNTSGGGQYASGTQITLSAAANSGWTFSHWSENSSSVSTSPTYSFIVDADRDLVANFVDDSENSYLISAVPNPVNAGTIYGTGTYADGIGASLVADAVNGWAFLNWIENGIIVSTDNPYQFVVSSNRNLTAGFVPSTASISNNEEAILKIYPNPTQGKVVIEFGDTKTYQISLINILGQLLIKQQNTVPYHTLSLTELAAGTYLVLVTDKTGKTWTRRIIKE